MTRLVAALAISSSLVSAPVAASPPPPLLFGPLVEYELTDTERATIDALLDALRSAEDAAADDAAAGFEELMTLFERIEEDPPLSSKSANLLEDRCFTALTIADALLDADDEQSATLLLDYVIRGAHSKELPIASYSKRLRRLYEERSQASELTPMGSVFVTCSEPCRVVLDEQVVGTSRGAEVDGLRIGEHRLYIEGTDDREDPTLQLLTISVGEPDVSVAFGSGPRDSNDAAPKRRRLPRWAGVTGVVVGAAMVIAGATLLALDETCPDGSDPAGADACDNVFDTLILGSALTAAGGVSLLGFSIALGIGEVRDKRAGGTQAHVGLGYTVRF